MANVSQFAAVDEHTAAASAAVRAIASMDSSRPPVDGDSPSSSSAEGKLSIDQNECRTHDTGVEQGQGASRSTAGESSSSQHLVNGPAVGDTVPHRKDSRGEVSYQRIGNISTGAGELRRVGHPSSNSSPSESAFRRGGAAAPQTFYTTHFQASEDTQAVRRNELDAEVKGKRSLPGKVPQQDVYPRHPLSGASVQNMSPDVMPPAKRPAPSIPSGRSFHEQDPSQPAHPFFREGVPPVAMHLARGITGRDNNNDRRCGGISRDPVLSAAAANTAGNFYEAPGAPWPQRMSAGRGDAARWRTSAVGGAGYPWYSGSPLNSRFDIGAALGENFVNSGVGASGIPLLLRAWPAASGRDDWGYYRGPSYSVGATIGSNLSARPGPFASQGSAQDGAASSPPPPRIRAGGHDVAGNNGLPTQLLDEAVDNGSDEGEGGRVTKVPLVLPDWKELNGRPWCCAADKDRKNVASICIADRKCKKWQCEFCNRRYNAGRPSFTCCSCLPRVEGECRCHK